MSLKGYRQLSQEEIDLINRVKEQGNCLEFMLNDLLSAGADPRWISIAKTDLQTGIMAAVRSIAKPNGF